MANTGKNYSANVNSTQLTSITSEQIFSVKPVLDAFDGCDVQVSAVFPGSPTDDLVINVYRRQNGSDWDVTPYMQFRLENTPSPNSISFTMEKGYEFQVGVERSGTTDTIISADMRTRLYTRETV